MLINDYLKAQHKIVRADNILLATHHRPDGDAIASVCALADYLGSLGKKFKIFCADPPGPQFSFLPHFEKFQTNISQSEFSRYDLVITLDCGQANRTKIEKMLYSRGEEQHLIEFDHHPKIEDYANLEIRVDDAAATCEILYYFFKANRIKITKNIANCLLTGIMTDTGNLVYESTTKDTIKIASEMLVRGAKLPMIIDNTWRNKSVNTMKAWGIAMDNLEINRSYNLAYSVISYEDMEKTGVTEEEMEGIAGFLSNLHGVKGLVFLRETAPGKIKGSLRTAHPNVDISKLAQKLGGGGHKRASGFILEGKINQTDSGWRIA